MAARRPHNSCTQRPRATKESNYTPYFYRSAAGAPRSRQRYKTPQYILLIVSVSYIESASLRMSFRVRYCTGSSSDGASSSLLFPSSKPTGTLPNGSQLSFSQSDELEEDECNMGASLSGLLRSPPPGWILRSAPLAFLGF